MNKIEKSDIDYFNANPNLNRFQRVATKSAIYPGTGTPLGIMYLALKLNGEAGELAEHIGKALRDDDWYGAFEDDEGNLDEGVNFAWERPLSEERRELIIKEIGDVLWYLSALCNEFNISLSEAARTNLKKLMDRTQRGTLRGSGDDR